MGTLTVQTLQAPTSGANANKVIIPSGHNLISAGHIIQVNYGTHGSSHNISNVTSQSSVTINNTTVRGTTSVTFNRQAANSHFLVLVGCSHLRSTTAGELRIGYRLNSGSDVLAYAADNESWVRSDITFEDTTTGSVGDSMNFEMVVQHTSATNNYYRHVMMCVWEIAQ